MREHPLLMQGPLVRATLAGLKTQTRRPLRNQPPSGYHLVRVCGPWAEFENDGPTLAKYSTKSSFGEAGARLWVRETWARPGDEEIIYRADKWAADLVAKWKEDPNCPQVKWTPSIHMPRGACRLFLPLVSVRVERVQDITEEDAKAEGVEPVLMRGIGSYPEWMRPTMREVGGHQKAFELLWKQIYGDALWDANPWVWVAEWDHVEVRK